ncbi:MAG: hypothetical protein KKC99_00065 [Proteobacteria bacterium]|nr:hypothetical protein [Pseudomonadota bacterium]
MDLDSDQTSPEETATFIGEAQLLLAEKRTSLATLRTGIAMLALPLSVVSLLVATSRLYTFSQVAYLALPLLAFCGLLVCVGAYLVGRSIHNIRRMDRHLSDLKRRSPTLAELID